MRPRTHGTVFLRFCIVYCSQGNREQPAHYLKQYKNAGKRFRVYGSEFTVLLLLSVAITVNIFPQNNEGKQVMWNNNLIYFNFFQFIAFIRGNNFWDSALPKFQKFSSFFHSVFCLRKSWTVSSSFFG